MKNRFTKIFVSCAIFLLFLCTGLQADVGFYVSNGRLYDAFNNEFIIRGISHAHCWYTDRTSAIADIASVGANAVRVVLSSGDHAEGWPRNEASDVQNMINLCKNNNMIAVLECHDTTGYGEKDGSVSLATAVNYWVDIKSVLDGQEDYVLINIGNEPYGNINYENWVGDTRNVISSMRSAGFDHTLVVDAPNWGQDWTFTMRDNAQSIYNADPTGNTVLSIHMYGVFEDDATVLSYISTIKDQGLPLMIGEFGWDHSDGDPDEASIMYRAAEYQIGYIGWSWCGNSGGVEYLDMVTGWDVNNMTDWGDLIVNGPNGLRSQAVTCSVFTNGNPGSPPAGPDPTTPPPSAGSCANVPVWSATEVYDQTGTRVQYNGRVYENNWYSTGENPEEYSGEFQVWTFIGVCEDGVPPDDPTPTPTPTGAEYVNGDVNESGGIDIVDALLVAQYYVGLSPSGFNVNFADTNCDGSVDIVDALLTAQYYVGLASSLEC